MFNAGAIFTANTRSHKNPSKRLHQVIYYNGVSAILYMSGYSVLNEECSLNFGQFACFPCNICKLNTIFPVYIVSASDEHLHNYRAMYITIIARVTGGCSPEPDQINELSVLLSFQTIEGLLNLHILPRSCFR